MPYAHTPSSQQPAITGNAPASSCDYPIGDQPHISSSALSLNGLPPMGPRVHKMPARYWDQLPEHPVSTHSPPAPTSTVRCVFLHMFDSFRTQFNHFGITHEYWHRPTQDPERFVSPDDLANMRFFQSPCHPPTTHASQLPWPWPNMTIWCLMTWVFTGSWQKSLSEVNKLVRGVLQAPDFNIQELGNNFDARTETRCLDHSQPLEHADDPFHQDNWRQSSVDIKIPTWERNPTGNGKTFSVEALYYRPLLDVICAVFAEALSRSFHLTPFKKGNLNSEWSINLFDIILQGLAVATRWWRAASVQWTLYIGHLEWSSGQHHEAKKIRWLQAGEGCSSNDALVQLYLFSSIRTCLHLAYLSFIR